MSSGALYEFQIKLKDGSTVEIDLAVNKSLEVLNSHLIRTYCLLDRRFQEAAIVLK